jgi:uncharacterized protein (DUF2141 family)/predicted small secreted protein
MKTQRIILFIALSALLLAGCANQLGPSGGDVDKTPPAIKACYPDSNTVNYSDKSFSFTFTKYVDKRSFRDALFISPAIDEPPDISWSGKQVEVTFKKGFKPGRTYNITVGTDVIDHYAHNRMAKAYTLTFATGPKIDKGSIRGTVFEDKPSGVMAYAYPASDTLEITKDKAEYISQVGEKGDFRFNGLALGTYRIFVVKDDFKDFLFHPEKDLIGVPSRDVTIAEGDSAVKGLHYFLSKIDTVKPRLLSAVMTDKYHVLATFSEELNFAQLSVKNFQIIDSTALKTYTPVFAFKGKAKLEEFVLALKAFLPDSNKIYLKAVNFSDVAGNVTSVDFASILTNQKGDTSAPQVFRINPPEKSVDVQLDTAHFSFGFDDGFRLDSLEEKVTLSDTVRNLVPIKVTSVDDASFQVTTRKKLKSNTPYILRFPFRKIVDLAGNSIDSLFEYHFTTANDMDNTGIRGNLVGYDPEKNPVLILNNVESPQFIYSTKPEKNGTFAFDKIKPGKYKLLCYYDLNKNGVCDKGFPKPFVPAEPFEFFKEVIGAPARWAVADIVFDVSDMK